MLQKRLRRIVTVDYVKFAFMPERNNWCCIYLEKDARKTSC